MSECLEQVLASLGGGELAADGKSLVAHAERRRHGGRSGDIVDLRTCVRAPAERALSRFEVVARDGDRDLIRKVAKRLAEDGPEAEMIQRAPSGPGQKYIPKKGGIDRGAPAGAARRISSEIERCLGLVARSICEKLSAAYSDADAFLASGRFGRRPAEPLLDLFQQIVQLLDFVGALRLHG
jgi:hypothetical protein